MSVEFVRQKRDAAGLAAVAVAIVVRLDGLSNKLSLINFQQTAKTEYIVFLHTRRKLGSN